jgi:hypothetical protein
VVTRRLRLVDDRPSGLDALEAELLAADPAALAELLPHLPDEDQALVERVVGHRWAMGWRAHPAAMAHHLTGGEIKLWAYIRLISESIAAGFRGDDNPHQVIAIPPQMGKTTAVHWTVVWALDFNPRLRILYVTYDDDKAKEEGRKVRDLVVAHSAHLRFTLRPDKTAAGAWLTDQGGGLTCVGVHGGSPGRPADVLIGDDLVKGIEWANSPTILRTVWSIYATQLRMRVQGPHCPILLVGNLWSVNDVASTVVRDAEDDPVHADQWKVIRLPAVAEPVNERDPSPINRVPDALGRQPGEVIEPDRFPVEEVEARMYGLAAHERAAVMQQRPGRVEGTEIKRDWWKWYDQAPPRFDQVISSWDTKLKDSEAGDFTVGQVWGRTGGNYWLLDQFRGQWSLAVAKVALALVHVRHPQARTHYVEAAGYGPELRRELTAGDPTFSLSDEAASLLGIVEEERAEVERWVKRGVPGILTRPAKGSKPVRTRTHIPKVEAGNVRLPAWHRGADVLVDEAAAFPDGAHDDTLDAWSQAMSVLGGERARVVRPTGTLPRR